MTPGRWYGHLDPPLIPNPGCVRRIARSSRTMESRLVVRSVARPCASTATRSCGRRSVRTKSDDRVEPLRRPLQPPAAKHDRECAMRDRREFEAGTSPQGWCARGRRRRFFLLACRSASQNALMVCATPFSSICESDRLKIDDRIVPLRSSGAHIHRHKHDPAREPAPTGNLYLWRLLRRMNQEARGQKGADKTSATACTCSS